MAYCIRIIGIVAFGDNSLNNSNIIFICVDDQSQRLLFLSQEGVFSTGNYFKQFDGFVKVEFIVQSLSYIREKHVFNEARFYCISAVKLIFSADLKHQLDAKRGTHSNVSWYFSDDIFEIEFGCVSVDFFIESDGNSASHNEQVASLQTIH